MVNGPMRWLCLRIGELFRIVSKVLQAQHFVSSGGQFLKYKNQDLDTWINTFGTGIYLMISLNSLQDS